MCWKKVWLLILDILLAIFIIIAGFLIAILIIAYKEILFPNSLGWTIFWIFLPFLIFYSKLKNIKSIKNVTLWKEVSKNLFYGLIVAIIVSFTTKDI